MAKSKQSLGKWGEEKAVDYLHSLGFVIWETNARTAYGEIDIVAEKDRLVVFVEVKTRRSKRYGPPEVSITDNKREKLIQSAMAFMQEHPELGNDWQIDVISVQHYKPGPPDIIHFENAISS